MKQAMPSTPILVVIPMFNAEPFIKKAIQSILDQSHSDFKLLIVNDGSTDGSEEAARSFQDDRIIVRNQANSGVGSVMNTAIEFAREGGIPFIACMAADDISMSKRLEIQLQLLNDYSQAACGSNSYYMESDTEQIIGSSTVPSSSWLIKWEIFHGLRGLIEGACTFRTSALAEVGGFRKVFTQAEDTDIFLRLAERYELMNSPQFLYKIRLNFGGLSVRNYRKNVLYHMYALDCSYRRRRGKTELDIASFENSLTHTQKIKILREVKYLESWRDYLTRRNYLSLISAAILSPRRLLSRVLRILDKGNKVSERT